VTSSAPPPAQPEAARPPSIRVRLPAHPVRLTYALLGLIVVVFLAQSSLKPLFGYDPIIALGMKENWRIAHGELWRLFTPIFIHGGVAHLLLNAYALYSLGREIEWFYGPLRFGLIFLLAGLSGSAASLLLNPSPSVGASGAIFGLVGAEGVLLYKNRGVFGAHSRRALQNVVAVVLLNLFIGLQGGIDNWAHLGGLAGGALLSWFIGPQWSAVSAPVFAAEITLEDQHALTGARWLAVLGFTAALAALTGFAIALRR